MVQGARLSMPGVAVATPMPRETLVSPDSSRRVKGQFDAIYNAPREALHDIGAEFVHHTDASTVGFQIRIEPTVSLLTHIDSIPFAKGRTAARGPTGIEESVRLPAETH